MSHASGRPIVVMAVCLAAQAGAQTVFTGGSAAVDVSGFVGIAQFSDRYDDREEWNGTDPSFQLSASGRASLDLELPVGSIDSITTGTATQSTELLFAPSGAFGGFTSQSTVEASQQRLEMGSDTNFASSELILEFSVTEPGFTYTLSGTIDAIRFAVPATELNTRFLIQRFVDGFPVQALINIGAARPEPKYPVDFDLAGELLPGDYRVQLLIGASADPPGDARIDELNYNWDVDFRIIPSPASVGPTVVAGLLGGARRRRG